MSRITQKREINVDGVENNDLITKVFVKENPGDYGAVVLPECDDAVIVNEVTVTAEVSEVESKGKNNTLDKNAPIRTRVYNKAKVSMDLHKSDSPTEPWATHALMKNALGYHETVSVVRNAYVEIKDVKSVVAGLKVESAGSLAGSKGNFIKVKFVNGGSTGSVSVSKVGSSYEVEYYNDSTVDDVVTAINDEADLACSPDVNGDSETDLFIDSLAASCLSSGSELRLSRGADVGNYYSNESDSAKDLCMLVNSEKYGELITGLIVQSMSLSRGTDIPVAEFELVGKKSKKQSVAKITQNVTAASKVYVGSAVKRFAFDSEAPVYVDIISQDRRTVKHSAVKLLGTGSDTAGYLTLNIPVTALQNDIVVFHEPAQSCALVNPLNGLSGSFQIGSYDLTLATNVKIDYNKNLELKDKYIFSSTLGGASATKARDSKFTLDLDWTLLSEELRQEMTTSKVFVADCKFVCGNEPGSIIEVQWFNVSFKYADLSAKADGIASLQVEGTTRSTVNGPSVIIQTK